MSTTSPSNQPASLFADPAINDSYCGDAAESLARQQIMSEINETKFLMKGSVTPEAVSFWKAHLEELSQRLVALSKEEQIRNASISLYGADSFNYADTNNEIENISNKMKQHYVTAKTVSKEGYLENNRKMREETGSGHSHQLSQSNTPSETLEAHADVVGSYRPANKAQEELPVCDVVAPSDLPGGYMFEAQLGDRKFLATVPPGGVTKGQRFVSTMKELETIEISVPLGGWRDEACDCFSYGIFHPLFLNTIFVPCSELHRLLIFYSICGLQ